MLSGNSDVGSSNFNSYLDDACSVAASPVVPNNSSDRDFFDKVLRIASKPKPKSKNLKKKSKGKSVGDINFYNFNDSQTKHPRPDLSYNELIVEALKASSSGMLSLQEIYDYIRETYLFFRHSTVVFLVNQAWQNSIRHNLSVQKMFERIVRPPSNPGKGGLWRIVPWASDTQTTPKKRKLEPEAQTCVNSPFVASLDIDIKDQSPQKDLQYEIPEFQQEYQGNHLMDTLATLALSADLHSQFQWPQDASADWIQPMDEYLSSPFIYRPELQMKRHPSPIKVMLDPLVGEKTLLQATNGEDLM